MAVPVQIRRGTMVEHFRTCLAKVKKFARSAFHPYMKVNEEHLEVEMEVTACQWSEQRGGSGVAVADNVYVILLNGSDFGKFRSECCFGGDCCYPHHCLLTDACYLLLNKELPAKARAHMVGEQSGEIKCSLPIKREWLTTLVALRYGIANRGGLSTPRTMTERSLAGSSAALATHAFQTRASHVGACHRSLLWTSQQNAKQRAVPWYSSGHPSWSARRHQDRQAPC